MAHRWTTARSLGLAVGYGVALDALGCGNDPQCASGCGNGGSSGSSSGGSSNTGGSNTGGSAGSGSGGTSDLCGGCSAGELCIYQAGGPGPGRNLCAENPPCGAVGACACIRNQGECVAIPTASPVCQCDNGLE